MRQIRRFRIHQLQLLKRAVFQVLDLDPRPHANHIRGKFFCLDDARLFQFLFENAQIRPRVADF